ncbi:MAG: T9SS type A sorting domain-containing protein [Bacteroidetes bacterium]|nr:T9SS type A sorting domain-containing protein [Bacteroidota bacterium]
MKKILIILMLYVFSGSSIAQKRNAVWCFGDSAGIDFSNLGSPQVFSTSLDTRGSCASIADTSVQLLFYAETNGNLSSNSTQVYNSIGQKMQNGDSILGQLWYHELLILPFPGNDSLYYLFSIGVSSVYGLKYCVIDMKANGGLGEVIQKNIQLQSLPMVDCLTAVKHGNGRDWWLLFRRWDPFTLDPNNEFHSYLISPAGITNYFVQNAGSAIRTGGGQISFNIDGTVFCNSTWADLIEVLDFDRCSAIISFNSTIQPEPTPPPNFQITWSSTFSPNNRFLYVSTSGADTNYLYQFDLNSPNVLASRLTLDTFYVPSVQPGSLKLAPDGKIYLSCAYYDGISFNYPYNSTEYNTTNMNLSVINYPDSLGTACGYAPFSFYLGGKRTYWGLPNNPDYDLTALTGSPCDTLVGIGDAPQMQQATLNVFYHTAWETAFINASNLKGKIGKLLVYDMQGKVVHSEPLRIQNGYYTRDLYMIGRADGVYLVVIETEQERLVKKMLVE